MRISDWSSDVCSSDLYMTDISNFKNFYVVEGRHSGLDQIEIRDYATNTPKRIAFPEDSYTAGLDDNPEYEVKKLRISYESMVTPDTIYDSDLSTGELEVLKVQEITSGYDASRNQIEHLHTISR